MFPSTGRASPVRTVKLARAVLVMVTFLVMNGQCQDEFLHCTDPGLEQERIIVTFRFIKLHTASCALRTGVVCCLPTCAQGSSAAVTGSVWGWYILGTLGALWSLVHMEVCWLCLCFPSCLQDSGYGGVPIAGHAQRAEVGGGILCVTIGEFTGLHQNCAHCCIQGGGSDPVEVMPIFASL